jgi:hypothetical protein
LVNDVVAIRVGKIVRRLIMIGPDREKALASHVQFRHTVVCLY